MFTPDNKIDPTKNISERKEDPSTRRKQPTRDFKEAEDTVDEKRVADDTDEESVSTSKKRGLGRDLLGLEDEKDLPVMNLFQLAKGGKEDGGEGFNKQERSDLVESIFGSSKKTVRPFDLPSEIKQDKDVKKEEPLFGLKTEKIAADEPKTGPLPFEMPDLSHVSSQNPTPFTAPVAPIAKAEAPILVRPIQEIIDQIVQQVYTLESSGKTETVISLRGNFEGSKLIITSFDSASGQLNITIDNLTARGQALLESNRGALLGQLADRNILVQQFIASTAPTQTRIELANGPQADAQDLFKRDEREGSSGNSKQGNEDRS